MYIYYLGDFISKMELGPNAQLVYMDTYIYIHTPNAQKLLQKHYIYIYIYIYICVCICI
jgi:hypothetical protein